MSSFVIIFLMPIITLTTDFGGNDPFFGIMKGVILKICPKARIEDITHDVSPQNVWQANFILQSSYHYFPKGTIHVCVVDPGVGSKRKPLLIQTKNYYFIGPDNGLFTGILNKEKVIKVIELTEKKYWLKNLSQTFHGRDIFSPVAAYLTNGIKPESFGKPVAKHTLVKLEVGNPLKKGNCFTGMIQYIDHFGNLITNISNNEAPLKIRGKVKNKTFTGLVSSFSQAENNKLTAIKGSSGFMELFINKKNAAKLTGIKLKDKVRIDFH